MSDDQVIFLRQRLLPGRPRFSFHQCHLANFKQSFFAQLTIFSAHQERTRTHRRDTDTVTQNTRRRASKYLNESYLPNYESTYIVLPCTMTHNNLDPVIRYLIRKAKSESYT